MAEALILTLNVGAMNERQLESESKASGSASSVLPAESPTNIQRISNDRVDLQKYFGLHLRKMLWYIRAANGCIALRLRGSHRRHHCQAIHPLLLLAVGRVG